MGQPVNLPQATDGTLRYDLQMPVCSEPDASMIDAWIRGKGIRNADRALQVALGTPGIRSSFRGRQRRLLGGGVFRYARMAVFIFVGIKARMVSHRLGSLIRRISPDGYGKARLEAGRDQPNRCHRLRPAARGRPPAGNTVSPNAQNPEDWRGRHRLHGVLESKIRTISDTMTAPCTSRGGSCQEGADGVYTLCGIRVQND